jgi:hypothetical protein
LAYALLPGDACEVLQDASGDSLALVILLDQERDFRATLDIGGSENHVAASADDDFTVPGFKGHDQRDDALPLTRSDPGVLMRRDPPGRRDFLSK